MGFSTKEWWEPAFSAKTSPAIVAEAKSILMRQALDDLTRGVQAFHARQSRDDVLSTFPGPVHVVTGADDVLPGFSDQLQASRSSPEQLSAYCPRMRALCANGKGGSKSDYPSVDRLGSDIRSVVTEGRRRMSDDMVSSTQQISTSDWSPGMAKQICSHSVVRHGPDS